VLYFLVRNDWQEPAGASWGETYERALLEFNEDVWFATVDKVVVYNGSDLTFHFKDGTELHWTI